MLIEGNIKVGTRTKDLIKHLSGEDIAVIQHDDIDELAAEAFIHTDVKAIINTGKSMTGNYLSKGTALMLQNKIYLFDTNLDMNHFKERDLVRIKGRDLLLNNCYLFSNSCLPVNQEYIEQKTLQAWYFYENLLSDFIDNTLYHAMKDKENILQFREYPKLETVLKGRAALVVVRSTESMEAVYSLSAFIENENPVLIGVDGGADALISCGFAPDILIGDMDSVTELGIYRSREVIVHAYADGCCPCLDRIKKLGVKYKILAMPGTSEDIALLLAGDMGSSSILLVGGNSSVTDFMERGRKGMGSTLIARLKLGERLIDYSHIKRLRQLSSGDIPQPGSRKEEVLLWMKM
jgi:uncharacterized membrane-anchored protein